MKPYQSFQIIREDNSGRTGLVIVQTTSENNMIHMGQLSKSVSLFRGRRTRIIIRELQQTTTAIMHVNDDINLLYNSKTHCTKQQREITKYRIL